MKIIIMYACFMASMFIGIQTTSAQGAKLLQEAEAGNAKAQTELGLHYANVKKDYTKAYYWWQKAAAQNDSWAQYYLGISRENNSDMEGAVRWYQKAAEQGLAAAQARMGLYYANTKKDYKQANYWWEKAAEQNEPLAQFNLGVTCNKNENVEGAVYWFKKAAEQGIPNAQYLLAEMYYSGEKIDKNYKAAVTYYEQVLESKNVLDYVKGDIYHKLSACYRFGRGVEANEEKANEYMELAAKYGNSDAKKLQEWLEVK